MDDNACLRCGHDLCMEHTAFGDGRCATCEDEFTRRFLGAKFASAIGGLALLGLVVGALVMTGSFAKIMLVSRGVPFGPAGIGLLSATGASGLVLWITRAIMRRRFLHERPGAPMTGVPARAAR